MMAFERLEPFGSLHTEFVVGQVCAVVANVNRSRDTKPFAPDDFFPALARARNGYKERKNEPVLLDDPEAQSQLLIALFKKHAPGTETLR